MEGLGSPNVRFVKGWEGLGRPNVRFGKGLEGLSRAKCVSARDWRVSADPIANTGVCRRGPPGARPELLAGFQSEAQAWAEACSVFLFSILC